MLENYFDKHHRGHKLSFNDFLSFEHVQAEIWYNDKGVTGWYFPCPMLLTFLSLSFYPSLYYLLYPD